MKIKQDKLLQILLEGNYIKKEDLNLIKVNARKKEVEPIDYLISENYLTTDLLGQAIAEFFDLPYADLNTNIPTQEQIKKIPADIAKEYRIVLYKIDPVKKEIIIATDDPLRKGLTEIIKKLFKNVKVKLAYSLDEDIEKMLRVYQKALDVQFTQIIKKEGRIAPEIVEAIFNEAIEKRVSDIHFEPQAKDEVVIRFRLDGFLFQAAVVSKLYYENILNRIKVYANMRIDEHFSAQDGAIRYAGEGGQSADMRVSIIPTINGEKVVLRLLASYIRSFNLENLGFTEIKKNQIAKAGKKPFGMILVSGPTGSGKTTTLYGLLKFVSTPDINVTTIEDPVELRMAGINQIQVNKEANLTFANGLRSIVRQDPDIILVGEIRDNITAEIAVNAALTGHLLFSTFHANDAITTIPRLLDMGIEPFLLSSTLELIVAQRLVRKICDHCRVSYSIKSSEIIKKYPSVKKYFKKATNTLYKGKGCVVCNQTGYKGRTGVFEFLEMTPKLQDLILKNPSNKEIFDLVKTEGFSTMFEDGLIKVKNGETTLEELLRVVEPSN